MRAKLAVLFVVLIALLASPQIVFAEGLAEPAQVAGNSSEEPDGPFNLVVELTFDESGEWVADLGINSPGLKPFPGLDNAISGNIKLENQSYESLTLVFEMFGMDIALPKADPVQVNRAVEAGLESLTVTKAFLEDGVQEIRIYANDRLLMVVEASGPLLEEALSGLGLGDMTALLMPFITEGETMITIRFPAEEAAEVTLNDELEPSEGSHKNVVSLGATVAESGEGLSIVSVAGFSVDEIDGLADALGAQIPLDMIPVTLLADYDVEQLAIFAGQDGLRVDAGDGRWFKLGWDADSRAAAVELLPAVGQFLYWDFGDVPTYLVMAEKWIAGTGVELNLYVSNTPQEDVPTLSIEEPLLVELGSDGGVSVDGFDLGPMGVAIDMAMLEPYLGAFPVAGRWDGDDTELRLSVGGDPMPSVFLDAASLPTVAGLFLSDAVPMEKFTQMLEDAHLEVSVGAEGEVPEPNFDYEIEGGTQDKVLVVPRLVIDNEGNMGLGEPAIRITSILEGMGIDISQATDMARLYALGYGDDLDKIGITVNPDAIGLRMDGTTAAEVLWDEEVRDNLLAFVEMYYPIPDIPLIGYVLPNWKTGHYQCSDGGWMGLWGIEIAIVDEIPASGLEATLKAFGLLR